MTPPDAERPQAPGAIRLTLFVSSLSPHAMATVDGITSVCRQLGERRCHLEIIDVANHAEAAERFGVVATPTLVRDDDVLCARVVGDVLSVEQLASRILPELMDTHPPGDGHDRVIHRIQCA